VVVALDADPGEVVTVTVEAPGKRPSLLQLEGPAARTPVPRKRFIQAAYQMVVEANPAIFPVPGVYHVVVRHGGRVLDRYAFGVVKAGEAEGNNDGNS
jgi:hypothetical protein